MDSVPVCGNGKRKLKVKIVKEVFTVCVVYSLFFISCVNNDIVISDTLTLRPVLEIENENFDNSLSIISVSEYQILFNSNGVIYDYSSKGKLLNEIQVYDLRTKSDELVNMIQNGEEIWPYFCYDVYSVGQFIGLYDDILMYINSYTECELTRFKGYRYFDNNQLGEGESFDYSVASYRGGPRRFTTSNKADDFEIPLDLTLYNDYEISYEENDELSVEIFYEDTSKNHKIVFPVAGEYQDRILDIDDLHLVYFENGIYVIQDAKNSLYLFYDLYLNMLSIYTNDQLSLFSFRAETSISNIVTVNGESKPIISIDNMGLFIYSSSKICQLLEDGNLWENYNTINYSEHFFNTMAMKYQNYLRYDFMDFSREIAKSGYIPYILPYSDVSYPVDLLFFDRESQELQTIPIDVYSCHAAYPIRVSEDGKYIAIPEQAEDGTFGHVVIYQIITD